MRELSIGIAYPEAPKHCFWDLDVRKPGEELLCLSRCRALADSSMVETALVQ